ncbi:unnamed protein product, partial [Polarella glacialis]
AVIALCSLDSCSSKAGSSQQLTCETCQTLCVMLQEKLDDLAPKSGLAMTHAACEVVAAALTRKGPCSMDAAWAPVAQKLELGLDKVKLACRRQMERLEEAMEAALAVPLLRDSELRQKLCLPPQQKDACSSIWDASEVPVSKQKAELLRSRARLREEQEGQQNELLASEFFEANAQLPGIEVLESGLQIKVLRVGQGRGPPSLEQKVSVHYRGMLIDCIPQEGPEACSGGTEFDSTYTCKDGSPSAERQACEKKQPITFTAAQAGSFWPDVLVRMREGSRVEAYVPYRLAYGSVDDPRKRPAKVGTRAALVFQVELVEVHDLKEAAVKTESHFAFGC